MSQLKVNTIRHTGASSDAITLANDGTAKVINSYTPPGNRNIIINGAMGVAQRGTANTAGNQGYQTVDRWTLTWNGANNVLEQHQNGLGSSDTGPWEAGFRKSFYVRNGDQTASSPDDDFVSLQYTVEARDLAESGWLCTDPNSKLTLSFWVKSSVAQTFYGYLYVEDGGGDSFSYSTGALSANTWKKVTVTIPGHADLAVNYDSGPGMTIYFQAFQGADKTTSGHTLGAWQSWNSSDRMPDNTSTWWTTNDAQLEITGVQLEVGDTATDFEHRSYVDEFNRCQRYYFVACKGDNVPFCAGESHNGSQFIGFIKYPTEMRTTPTLKHNDGTDYYQCYGNSTSDSCDSVGTARNCPTGFVVSLSGNLSLTQGTGTYARTSNASALIAFDAEY